MGLLNQGSEGGVVTSNSFNLTRIAGMVAAALGALTAGSGVVARAVAPSNEDPNSDLVGFDKDQRFILIVVLIAAGTVVIAIDTLSRAIATSRALSAGLIPLPAALPVRLTNDKPGERDRDGEALALRADGDVLFRDQNTGQAEWCAATSVTFDRRNSVGSRPDS